MSFNQFAITIGIMLAYVFDYFLLNFWVESWRYMLAVPAVFAVIYLIYLLTSFPENPRWLLSKDKKDEAVKVLHQIGGEEFAQNDLKEIQDTLAAEKKKDKVTIGELFKGKTGKIVMIGTLIAAFQQINGINAVIFFCSRLFQSNRSRRRHCPIAIHDSRVGQCINDYYSFLAGK